MILKKENSRSHSSLEFLLWLSELRTQCSLCEDAGSIPGLAQWVKDLALLQAVAEIADAGWFQCCHDCGIGLSGSSDSTPAREIPHDAGVAIKK